MEMEENHEDDKLYCPNCGSPNLVANKKGFGAGKALTGALLTGGVGLLAGFIGSNKVKVTCLKCGHKCNAGELLDKEGKDKLEKDLKEAEKELSDLGCGGVSILIIAIFIVGIGFL